MIKDPTQKETKSQIKIYFIKDVKIFGRLDSKEKSI